MTIAVFDYERWAARYPELVQRVDQYLGAELFEEAGLYLANTDASVVPCDPSTFQPRLLLLGMIVAHLAALRAPERDGAVGRVSQASQGSVSVTLEMAPATAGAAWWQQTVYGASYWQSTARFRLGGRYVVGKCSGPRVFVARR